MKTIKVKLYEFDELSEKAKEKARDWFRESAVDYDWWQCTYEDAERIGLKIESFGLDRNRHAEGKFIQSPEKVIDLIIAEHGKTCETYKTAREYKTMFAKINKTIAALEEKDKSTYDVEQEKESLAEEFLKSLLEDYSINLQQEYEYLLSDESVDENIKCNEYTFLEDGKRFN